jgi:uncharacterized protein YdcH (DUF465 family)
MAVLSAIRLLYAEQFSHYGGGMSRIEQQLVDISHQIEVLTKDLSQSREQYSAIDEMTEEARIRAIVSENPSADHDAHEMERARQRLEDVISTMEKEILALKTKQDELLEILYESSQNADTE